MIAFDCCECGRHVVAIVAEKLPAPPLCAWCLFLPSWHKDAQLVKIIDPEREGADLYAGNPDPAKWDGL